MSDKPLTTNQKKAVVVRALLHQAGNLVEFWTDLTADTEGADQIDAEFARTCLHTWLWNLPGTGWDTRLDPPTRRA